MKSIAQAPAPWEPKRHFADRWGVCAKTVDRWHAAGLLEGDAVTRINGRLYVRADAIPATGTAVRRRPVPTVGKVTPA